LFEEAFLSRPSPGEKVDLPYAKTDEEGIDTLGIIDL